MRIGLYFDLRNPRDGRRPWHHHYTRTTQLIVDAESAGIDSVWLSEHHLFDDGYLSQPLMYAAALTQRTQRIRIGTAVLLASLKNPLQLAEEAALADVLSNGRLDLGVGVGYRRPEFDAFHVDRSQRFRILQRNIEAVTAYWSTGQVVPAPIQDPFPWWGGFFGPRGARLAGTLGMGLLSLRADLFSAYQAGLAEGGHPAELARVGGPLSFVLSDDPERDWPELRPYVAYQRSSYQRYALEGSGVGDPGPVDADEYVRRGRGNVPMSGIMTPAEAADRIIEVCAGMPVSDVFVWASIGAMPDALQERHIELVCTELLPELRARAGGALATATAVTPDAS